MQWINHNDTFDVSVNNVHVIPITTVQTKMYYVFGNRWLTSVRYPTVEENNASTLIHVVVIKSFLRVISPTFIQEYLTIYENVRSGGQLYRVATISR